jgi:hypothetical protein
MTSPPSAASSRRGLVHVAEPTSTPTRELQPIGRFAWEQILRRIRKDDLTADFATIGKNGSVTRGRVSATTFMSIAMTLASYGNLQGEDIWPGDPLLAVDCGTSLKTVKTVRSTLVKLGLLEPVSGPRNGRGKQYRLTLPTDLLEHVTVYSPAQQQAAAQRLREQNRGSRKTDSRASGESGGPPTAPQPQRSPGGPADTPDEQTTPHPGGSTGPAAQQPGGSTGPPPGGPLDPRTKPRPLHVVHPANVGVGVVGPVTLRARETRTTQTHIDFRGRGDSDAGRQPALPPQCPEHPGMKAGRRDDGRPHCTFCRRLGLRLVPSPPPEPHPAGGTHPPSTSGSHTT